LKICQIVGKNIKTREYLTLSSPDSFLQTAVLNYDEEIIQMLLEMSEIGNLHHLFCDWKNKSPPPRVKLLFDVMHGKKKMVKKPKVRIE
jgi:hypothetical protein